MSSRTSKKNGYHVTFVFLKSFGIQLNLSFQIKYNSTNWILEGKNNWYLQLLDSDTTAVIPIKREQQERHPSDNIFSSQGYHIAPENYARPTHTDMESRQADRFASQVPAPTSHNGRQNGQATAHSAPRNTRNSGESFYPGYFEDENMWLIYRRDGTTNLLQWLPRLSDFISICWTSWSFARWSVKGEWNPRKLKLETVAMWLC